MDQGGVGPFVFRRKIIKNPDLDDAQPPAPSPMALGLQISQGQWQAKMDVFFIQKVTKKTGATHFHGPMFINFGLFFKVPDIDEHGNGNLDLVACWDPKICNPKLEHGTPK